MSALVAQLARLGRHAAIYGLGDAASRGVGLVLVPLYTRAFASWEFGLLSSTYALLAFMAVVTACGFDAALLRSLSLARTDSARKEVVTTALVGLVVAACVFGALVWWLAEFGATFVLGEPAATPLLRLGAAILVVDALGLAGLLVLRVAERSVLYSALVFAKFALTVGANLLVILVLGRGVQGVFEANLAVSVLVCAAVLPWALRMLTPRLSMPTLRRLLAFGLPMVPAVLAQRTIDLADLLLLGHMVGLDAAGIYRLGYRLGMVVLVMVGAFRTAWTPFALSIAHSAEAGTVYASVLTYVTLVGVAAMLLLTAVAKPLVDIVSGGGYDGAAAIVPLIALAYALYGIYLNFTVAMTAEGRGTWLLGISGTAAAVNVGLNLVLIPLWGASGAAAATVAAYAWMTGWAYLAQQRLRPVAYEWGRMGAIALAAIAGVIIMSAPALGAPEVGVWGPAGLAAFAGGLFALGAVGARERALLREALRWLRPRAVGPGVGTG